MLVKCGCSSALLLTVSSLVRPVATVLIVRGCLTISSHLLAGTCHAKVRLMNDSAGKAVKQAYPGMAVTVSGWKELPNAGDEVLSGPEGDVKKALANRIRKAEIEVSLADMEAINAQRISDRRKETEEGEEVEASEAISGPKELRLIIKGDVSGSVEALEGALQGIGNSDAVAKIVSTGVGDVTESDVNMAKTAGGMSFILHSQTSHYLFCCVKRNDCSFLRQYSACCRTRRLFKHSPDI